jgi:HSP20 family protein
MADDVKTSESQQATGSQSSGNQTENKRGAKQGTALQGSPQQGGQQGGRSMQQHRTGAVARHARHPFALMQELSEDMDRLFDSFLFGFPARRRGATAGTAEGPTLWSPEIDISTQGNELCVTVDLPGVPKDSVKVDMNDGMLTIQGERHEERSEGGEQQRFHRTERRYGSFYRSIALPEGASVDQAKAQMKDGVLRIVIPMTEQSKGRSLQIEG